MKTVWGFLVMVAVHVDAASSWAGASADKVLPHTPGVAGLAAEAKIVVAALGART